MFEWVEGKLYPIFDSTPAGSYPAAETVALTDCPVCGRPMTEHTIDHSRDNTVLICPEPPRLGIDSDEFKPVNELGMVIHPTSGDTPTSSHE